MKKEERLPIVRFYCAELDYTFITTGVMPQNPTKRFKVGVHLDGYGSIPKYVGIGLIRHIKNNSPATQIVIGKFIVDFSKMYSSAIDILLQYCIIHARDNKNLFKWIDFFQSIYLNQIADKSKHKTSLPKRTQLRRDRLNAPNPYEQALRMNRVRLTLPQEWEVRFPPTGD